jgi:hypothetical protein
MRATIGNFMDLDQAVGRKLTGVVEHDSLVVLKFEEGRYCCIRAMRCWDEAELDQHILKLHDYEDRASAVHAGLITEAEVDAILAEKKAKDRGIEDVRRRKLYEQLKQEFGE